MIYRQHRQPWWNPHKMKLLIILKFLIWTQKVWDCRLNRQPIYLHFVETTRIAIKVKIAIHNAVSRVSAHSSISVWSHARQIKTVRPVAVVEISAPVPAPALATKRKVITASIEKSVLRVFTVNFNETDNNRPKPQTPAKKKQASFGWWAISASLKYSYTPHSWSYSPMHSIWNTKKKSKKRPLKF